MNETQARTFREARDGYVRSIYRKPKTALAALYRDEQAARGIQMLYGGPGSKDELISALVELRYPAAKMNESTHVLYHGSGESWSACEHCHPHQGGICECALGRVQMQVYGQVKAQIHGQVHAQVTA